jgi:hypothetical protein
MWIKANILKIKNDKKQIIKKINSSKIKFKKYLIKLVIVKWIFIIKEL